MDETSSKQSHMNFTNVRMSCFVSMAATNEVNNVKKNKEKKRHKRKAKKSESAKVKKRGSIHGMLPHDNCVVI